MGAQVEFARAMMTQSRRMFVGNTRSLTLEQALFAGEGYRSILGVIKHIAGWTHVYRSYAFEDAPQHWAQTAWPRGLRDTVDLSPEYLAELLAWADEGMAAWDANLADLDDEEMAAPHRLHMGATLPLNLIVVILASHVAFHTGELNMLLSITKGEAWEYSEEVEENHISTYGHGVRPDWMPEPQAVAHEERMRLAHEARVAERSG